MLTSRVTSFFLVTGWQTWVYQGSHFRKVQIVLILRGFRCALRFRQFSSIEDVLRQQLSQRLLCSPLVEKPVNLTSDVKESKQKP